MDKRTFLKSTSVLGLSLAALPVFGKIARRIEELSPTVRGVDDDFWEQVRGEYKINPDFINLENGYYCITPKPVLSRYLDHIKYVNLEGAHYMRTVQFDNKNRIAHRLAKLAGCSEDELVITRNTTESLDMIINGQHWKRGDEAIMAEQDYGAMLDMFKQVSRRFGTVNKIISIPQDPKSDEEIVDLYERAITPRTRLLMVCHMINITGHLLPVRKICDMAHKHGVQVMVDGAHAFAHLHFRIDELNCDYYGSSLHKWLSAPLGAGMLYVRKEHIPKVWPVFADSSKKDNDILRLNHTGTNPVTIDLTVNDAIDYYLSIGAERKESRLRYLQNYWVNQVKHLPGIHINTPSDPARSCGIANVGIKGMKPADMADALMKKYGIYTVAIDNAGVQGCRITPNVFTTTDELDVLVDALTELQSAGKRDA
jgi:selenocysteine lyase/cysteine desulfurase